jgi:hypothetical protein
MLPIPDPAESQPEYAIRFHTQMAQAIPRTDERNAKMLETWEKYGNEQERSIADGLFAPDQYEKRKNIAIFAEHETPRGDKYDQAALKAIAEKHNYRIRDTNTFSPITDGHTSDDPKHPKPATLGFSGPARLGMIGNENPRWAIFADEYQRKDAGEILKDSPGRSVEIWKHPNMADRFFYPIAALRVDAPRLDLPPARYAKAEGGDRVLVECYSLSETLEKDSFMMAAPGGNATFIPGGGHDQYGDVPRMSPPEGEDLPEDAGKFNDLMDAFMRTEFAQMALKLLEKEGQQVASPPISQPPDPVEMPYDSPHAQTQGQPGAGVSPSPNPAAPPVPPVPPVPPNAGPPMAAKNPAPPMPPGANGGPPNPPMPPGKDERFQMSETRRDRYSALNERIDALAEENKTLRAQVRALAARNAAQDRYSKLNELADEYQVDIAKELNRTEKYSAEQFDQHLEVIRENYSRRADAGVADFATLAGAGMKQPFQKSTTSLGPDDFESIRKLCVQKGLGYDEGRDQYMKDKAAKEHAPTVAS